MKTNIIELFARHRVAANLLMIAMVVSGLWAIMRMNTQFLPNFDINFISISIVWPGASAKDIERSITIPIEEELRNVDEVKKITSTSHLGTSKIWVEFNADANMNEAFNNVKQSISAVRNLPKDSEPPIVKRMINYERVANLLIVSHSNLAELRPLIYKFERQLLDKGISKINIVGLPQQEIAIEIPSLKLAELNLSLTAIAKRISEQSANIPAGTVGKNEVSKELRSNNKKRTIRGFAEIPIKTDNKGHIIRLGDIATIRRQSRSLQTHVSYFGRPAVQMTLQRTRHFSALKSAKILQNWLAEVKPNLPKGIKIIPYYQSWQLIKERINLMLKNAVFGLILILILLFLFLNIRIAAWVAIGIPASFLFAIFVLYFLGGTINMISLFAMIMTLGIIVDDSIVIGEEILSQIQSGQTLFTAIKKGTHFMFTPIMASSLTTIVTFTPLMLVTGIIGQVLFDIPLFVICIIIASLVECFLVLPGHIFHSSKKSTYKPPIMQPYFSHFRDIYFRRLIEFSLKHRWSTLCFIFSFFIITIGILIGSHLKFNFFPNPEGTRIYADIQFTASTPSQQVKKFLTELEKSLKLTNAQFKKNGEDIVKAGVSFYKRSTITREGDSHSGDQYASMHVELSSPDQRTITNQKFIDTWRKNINLPAGIENFVISTPRTGPPGRDIDIELTSKNIKNLKAAATILKQNLNGIPGVTNIVDDLPFGKEHLIFQLTSQGHALELTTTEIGQQLRAAFQGEIAQIFHEPHDEIEVRVTLPPHERYHLGTLSQFPIITPEGSVVPLSSVAILKNQIGFDDLRHTNGQLAVRVTAEVNPKINTSNLVLQLIKDSVIPQLQKQYQVQINFSGRAEEQATTFKDMLFGLLLAIVLVYLILAWVFSSYLWPLLVMVAIPLGLTGAVWGHVIMHIPLTLLSLFGFFGLAGIVVNDSIILLNRYRQLRVSQPSIKTAIIEAACQRLRPVLLTSMTTIAGLTPLLFETSLQAQFLIPMAVSITFGLLMATVLILIVIPVLLYLIEPKNHSF